MHKKINTRSILCIGAAIAIIIIIVLAILFTKSITHKPKPDIITKSTLEKIINVSDLSTFEAVYNGVAKVMNEDNPEKVDYYVSYKSKVKAGIDLEKVNIIVDEENKLITINLPEIKIMDPDVDITSLDYIFENEKANTSTVLEEAYKKCIEDVTNESSKESAILELAEQNARNIIEALTKPFIEQLDTEYHLEIN